MTKIENMREDSGLGRLLAECFAGGERLRRELRLSEDQAEEQAAALIEEIGQQIEQSLSGSTLGDIAQEDHSGDTRKLDTLHGFPVSKKFEDLQFGRKYDPKKR